MSLVLRERAQGSMQSGGDENVSFACQNHCARSSPAGQTPCILLLCKSE